MGTSLCGHSIPWHPATSDADGKFDGPLCPAHCSPSPFLPLNWGFFSTEGPPGPCVFIWAARPVRDIGWLVSYFSSPCDFVFPLSLIIRLLFFSFFQTSFARTDPSFLAPPWRAHDSFHVGCQPSLLGFQPFFVFSWLASALVRTCCLEFSLPRGL